MTLKKFETFVIIAIISVVGVIYALTQKPQDVLTPSELAQSALVQEQAKTQEPINQVQQVSSSDIKYKGVEGKNALELLKASHRVDTKDYPGVGEFVTAIDGLETDSKTSFWAFYVNGKQSPVGASAYITKDSDELEWKVETIDQ